MKWRSQVPRKFLDEWMDNPDVDGWYIGTHEDGHGMETRVCF